MLTDLERQERWIEARKEVMAQRHALTQIALAEGIDPPQWAPLPLAMPKEFLRPASTYRRVEQEPLAPIQREAQLTPEETFAAKAKGKAKELIRAQGPQPKYAGAASARRPKIREEIVEIASTASTPTSRLRRQAHEQPQPNERLEDFFARVQGGS